MDAPSRIVHCQDALAWLESGPPLEGCSFFTSLPDASEVPQLSREEWQAFFVRAARLVLAQTPALGAAVFYQSDVKREGLWVDKAYLVQRAAEEEGARLLWHKIVCRRPPGTQTYGRAGYGHLLCFSREAREDLAHATPDVIGDAGGVIWARGIGVNAVRTAVRWLRDHTPTRTVVDPFCGLGTVLAVANDEGLGAVGVELNQKRARRARTVTVAQLATSEA